MQTSLFPAENADSYRVFSLCGLPYLRDFFNIRRKIIMENLFLTESESDKKYYSQIMEKTNSAILESFDNPNAYTGPEPLDLKKIIRMDSILPEKGMGFDGMFSLVKEKILPNMLRPSSTDYMPHLHSPALVESLAAEQIISAYNQSMDSWDQAPAATEIEVDVTRHLCALYGFGYLVQLGSAVSVQVYLTVLHAVVHERAVSLVAADADDFFKGIVGLACYGNYLVARAQNSEQRR